MHSFYLDAIRKFEGYTPQASWDYAQFSNGYGTKARYPGEVIDKAEAERRFQAEVAGARSIVEKHAPHVDEGTKAALTSLTYNAGTSWISSGLGDAVRRGDLEQARAIFQKYNKAGGEVLPGLVSRRAQEALWIGNPDLAAGAAARQSPSVVAALEAATQRDAIAPAAKPVMALARSLAFEKTDVAAEPFRAALRAVAGDRPAAAIEQQQRADVSGGTLDDLLRASGVDPQSQGPDRKAVELARLVLTDGGVELRGSRERGDDGRDRA